MDETASNATNSTTNSTPTSSTSTNAETTSKKTYIPAYNRFYKLDNELCSIGIENNYYWFATYIYAVCKQDLITSVDFTLNDLSNFFYKHVTRKDRRHREDFAEALYNLTKETPSTRAKNVTAPVLLDPLWDSPAPDPQKPENILEYAVYLPSVPSYFTRVYPIEFKYIARQITYANIANTGSRTAYDLPTIITLYYWLKAQCGTKEKYENGVYRNTYNYLGNLFELDKNTVLKYFNKLEELNLINIVPGYPGKQSDFSISLTWKDSKLGKIMQEYFQ